MTLRGDQHRSAWLNPKYVARMSTDDFRDFVCSRCTARYKIVRAVSEPGRTRECDKQGPNTHKKPRFGVSLKCAGGTKDKSRQMALYWSAFLRQTAQRHLYVPPCHIGIRKARQHWPLEIRPSRLKDAIDDRSQPVPAAIVMIRSR
jgi:hypothetical protein